MNVSDRLREIIRSAGSRAPGPISPPSSASPHTLGRAGSIDIADVLGGRWSRANDTRTLTVERVYAPVDGFGQQPIHAYAQALQKGVSAASMLVGGRPVACPMVFFDLETTGLSGGAGTVAFLTGCGWFDDEGGFRTRQNLLVSLDAEAPMLEALAEDIGGAGTLVSFNGKSFDVPLLELRYAFHRLPWRVCDTHLDVLHVSRRFWKDAESTAESGCSLASLERRVLDAPRQGDIPSAEIPARYFRFIRSGDVQPLAGVLEHNRRDLLSLACLTARLLDLLVQGPCATSDGGVALALGRVYAAAGRDAEARLAFQQALTVSSRSAIRVHALRALAEGRRRAREHQRAADCWQQLLEAPECPVSLAQEAARALAIHHEHRLRDLVGARAYTLRLARTARQNERVQFRLARIERKMSRLYSPGLPFYETVA
jgi:uncharacterized protein YprB with RNaseH-like and TPR domain